MAALERDIITNKRFVLLNGQVWVWSANMFFPAALKAHKDALRQFNAEDNLVRRALHLVTTVFWHDFSGDGLSVQPYQTAAVSHLLHQRHDPEMDRVGRLWHRVGDHLYYVCRNHREAQQRFRDLDRCLKRSGGALDGDSIHDLNKGEQATICGIDVPPGRRPPPLQH